MITFKKGKMVTFWWKKLYVVMQSYQEHRHQGYLNSASTTYQHVQISYFIHVPTFTSINWDSTPSIKTVFIKYSEKRSIIFLQGTLNFSSFYQGIISRPYSFLVGCGPTPGSSFWGSARAAPPWQGEPSSSGSAHFHF